MSDPFEIYIGGKTYRMAVEEGQEPRVKSVAAKFESYVERLAGQNIDRDRMLVLAAIMMADDFLSLQQEQDTQMQSLDKFHNGLAERLEKLLAG